MSERFRRIGNIWNWLPAFRAVAETEHLPTASEMMNVTPPALSRTVKQLEDALGYPVFDRQGRSIVLNEKGHRLLAAVRESMRRVDDVIDANNQETFSGAVRWTCNWSLTGMVLDTLRQMVTEHPALLPKMVTLEPNDLAHQLLRGELDVAVINNLVDIEGLTSTKLGEVPHAVFCGREHPLYGRKQTTLEQLAEHAFAAPTATPNGVYEDGWPNHITRHVVMEFSQMSVGFRACRDHALLAVLPDDVAEDEDGLWRLMPIQGTQTAYALHRQALHDDGPVQLLVDGVQKRLQIRRDLRA